MPKVFTADGLDYFFCSNEGHKPMHVHVRKGRADSPEAEAKFWIDPTIEDYVDGFSKAEERRIRTTIAQRRAEIITAWHQHFGQ